MPQRGDSLRRAREEKRDSFFKGRHWRVRTEVTERRESDGTVIVYDKGEFWVQPPEVFQTPLGHRGRHGFLLRETGADGKDLAPANDVAFGFVTLKTASDLYGSVRDLPEEPRKAPPSAFAAPVSSGP
jgi:hypothetical protein